MFRQRTLDNGVEVVSLALPTSPVVAVRAEVGVGSACEASDTSGYAHLLEHVLVRADDLGVFGSGHVGDAWTSKNTTAYTITALRSEALDAARAILNTITTCRINDATLRQELTAINHERAERTANPFWRIRERLCRALWTGGPYARPILGDPDVLRNATLDDLRGFHAYWYVPANITLYVIGDTSSHDIAEAMSSTCAANAAPAPPQPPVPAINDFPITVREPLSGGRAAFAIGFAHNPPTACAADTAALTWRVLRATTGIDVHQLVAGCAAATWLTVIGSAEEQRPTGWVRTICDALQLAETALRTDRDTADRLVSAARIRELRQQERLESLSGHIADRWRIDRSLDAPTAHFLRLNRVGPHAIADGLSRLSDSFSQAPSVDRSPDTSPHRDAS